MDKLSICRICLVGNVRMCVVTNKSLQEMYEKLTGVPFVTEDLKPMLACFFCFTRLKQCCQMQRKCVEAEELLAQMLSEDYEQKPLTNRGHLEFAGGLIITPIENISIVYDCQIGSDAIKQELPAVCEEHDDELVPENMYNSHPDVELHHSESESETEQLLMKIKIEEEEFSKALSVRETKKLELQNPDKSYPGVGDIPAHDSESDSEDDVPLMEIKTEAEEGQEVSKRKRRACVTQRAAVAKKPTLKRKLEDTVPAKQTRNVLSDSKIIQTTKPSTSKSVAKTKEPITTTSQSSFSQSSNLIRHTLTHSGVKSFICDICHRSFGNKAYLKVHFKIHSGEKPFKCDMCQCSFKSKSNLKMHFRKHSGEKPFKCDICQRSFSSKSNLRAHFRKHSGEKPFKCDVCQRSFSQKIHWITHSRVHTGEKPYKCDVCQRSFNRKSQCKIHSRIHTGEKPYKCDVCQRSFNRKSQCKIHSRIHTGEKPYKCDVCQRSFNRKSQCKIHSRIHTGEKPYKCDVCKRSYMDKGSLNKHFRKHSGENTSQV